MEHEKKLDSTGTSVRTDDATTRIKVRQAMAILEEMTEGTTVLHRYPPDVAPTSWMQRVLAWFRKG